MTATVSSATATGSHLRRAAPVIPSRTITAFEIPGDQDRRWITASVGSSCEEAIADSGAYRIGQLFGWPADADRPAITVEDLWHSWHRHVQGESTAISFSAMAAASRDRSAECRTTAGSVFVVSESGPARSGDPSPFDRRRDRKQFADLDESSSRISAELTRQSDLSPFRSPQTMK